jgi:O-antigen/teichoic acid export membrane protein
MLRRSGLMVLAMAMRLGANLFVFALMAHAWGAETFGVFMFPFVIATVLVKLLDYGFGLQTVRDLVLSPGTARTIMDHTTGAKVALGLLTLLLAGSIAPLLPRAHPYGLLLMILVADAALASFSQFLVLPFRARGDFATETRLAALGNAMLLLLVLPLLWAGAGVVGAALGMAAARALHLASVALAYVRAMGSLPWTTPWSRDALVVLRPGLPYGVHIFVGTMYAQVDTILLQFYLGSQAVGLHQAGMRLVMGAVIVADAVNNVYLPAMTGASECRLELTRLGTQITRYLLLLGCAAMAVLGGGAAWIARLVFGPDFDTLAGLLPLFGVLILLRYGGLSYGLLLTATGGQGRRMAAVCGVLLVNTGLNVLLIPGHGVSGAVAASVLSHMLLYSIYGAYVWRETRSFLLDRRSVVLIAIGALAALLFLLPSSVPAMPLPVIAGAVLVAAVAAGVEPDEWRRVWHSGHRIVAAAQLSRPAPFAPSMAHGPHYASTESTQQRD